jgi:hypothetical protein
MAKTNFDLQQELLEVCQPPPTLPRTPLHSGYSRLRSLVKDDVTDVPVYILQQISYDPSTSRFLRILPVRLQSVLFLGLLVR